MHGTTLSPGHNGLCPLHARTEREGKENARRTSTDLETKPRDHEREQKKTRAPHEAARHETRAEAQSSTREWTTRFCLNARKTESGISMRPTFEGVLRRSETRGEEVRAWATQKRKEWSREEEMGEEMKSTLSRARERRAGER